MSRLVRKVFQNNHPFIIKRNLTNRTAKQSIYEAPFSSNKLVIILNLVYHMQ